MEDRNGVAEVRQGDLRNNLAAADPGRPEGREVAAGGVVAEGSLTPLTNRGSFVPSSGRVDYLKITVWADAESVQTLVTGAVLEGYYSAEFAGWHDLGPGGRCSARWEGVQGLMVLEYGGAGFVSVEVKGVVCEVVGSEGIRSLIVALQASGWRCRASRIDWAWDGVPFTVDQVHEAMLSGRFLARGFHCESPKDVTDYHQNGQGKTVYVGNKRGDRFLRVYDRRGPVRLEMQLQGRWSESLMTAVLWALDIGEWGNRFMMVLRDLVEFVESADDRHADRAKVSAWWSAFVAGKRERCVSLVDAAASGSKPTSIGALDYLLQRSCRRLQAAVEAFGAEWLVSRIAHHAASRRGGDFEALVADLKVWKRSGLVGLPTFEPEEVPF